MHEHLLIGWPGWEVDAIAPRWDRGEAKRLCVDRMQELKALGVSALVDPCPIDLGRDVEFAADVAQAAGVRVICATGGRPLPMPVATMAPKWDPRHIFQHILPALREAGVPNAKIDAMLVENPRRYFTR